MIITSSSPSCGFTFPSGWPTITASAPSGTVTSIVISSSSGSDVYVYSVSSGLNSGSNVPWVSAIISRPVKLESLFFFLTLIV